MTKITINVNKENIDPPGFALSEKDIVCPQVGSVSFPKRKSVGILAPYVEAYYDSKKNILTAKAVVYVDLTAENIDFKCRVFQNCYIDMDGNAQLQFFIAYDTPEKVSKDFTIHEISFEANKDYFKGQFANVKTIQTFLWDIDPETSRGTETTVQHGG